MRFNFSREGLRGGERCLQRFLEILPGAASWAILAGMVVLSFRKPLTAAVIIIAFDLYWLLRLFYMTFFLVLSYFILAAEKETDWIKEARALGNPESYKPSFRRRRKELERLLQSGVPVPAFEDIWHLVIIPVAREAKDIVAPGIEGLRLQKFPPKKILVVLALEERAGDAVKQGMAQIAREYKDSFFDFLLVTHPDGLAGEARVKGANVTYAAKEAAAYFKEKKIPFENITVSCFDADTVVDPNYFACLTYTFMVCPHRTRASFQPIPVYHNNIWEVPGFARVLETGSSFFQLTEATNPEKLVTFSSHSMSFKALVDVDYWPVDMISDDSAIFWKSFIYFEGDYRVVPMTITVSMDIASSDSLWKTVQNLYKQKRRWAWGVENFPLVVRGFLNSPRISFYDKLRHAFKMFEGHVAWATWAFLLTFASWLPAVFAGREFSSTVLYYSAPRITLTIFNLSLLSLFVAIILSLLLLPRRKPRRSVLARILFAFEWLSMPFVVIFLSALPALDAQTRLLLGRYMEFWVTEKKR